MTRGPFPVLPLLVLAALLPIACLAHEIRPAVVTVTFAPPAYTVDISGNVEAMIAGVGPNVADTSESPNAQRYDALRRDPPETLQQRVREFAPQLVQEDGAPAPGGSAPHRGAS